MRILARERSGARLRLAGVAWGLAALACGPGEGAPLAVAERIPLPSGSFSTLSLDPAGRVWLGGAGEARVMEGGREVLRLPSAGDAAPRVVAATAGRIHLRSGAGLRALDPPSGEVLAEREEVAGVVLPDVRGRFLLVVSPSGGVLGLDPLSLEPLWAWPSLGESGAAALSPEGDRVHLAADDGEGAAALLSRDLQTGRAVLREEISAPVRALVTGSRGELIALVGEAGAESVVALVPGPGGFRPLWRRSLGSLRLEGAAEMRVGRRGSRLALFAPGNETGLRVLDAETGEPRGSARGAVLDAAFGADGSSLYLLTPAEMRVARVR